jgi:hypothetical protein
MERELGTTRGTLRKCRNRYQVMMQNGAGKLELSHLEAAQAALRRPQQEPADAKQERGIPGRAVSFSARRGSLRRWWSVEPPSQLADRGLQVLLEVARHEADHASQAAPTCSLPPSGRAHVPGGTASRGSEGPSG